MSRSVKKSPVCNDHHTPGTRWAKQQASKTVRRYAGDMQNGKWYRKLFCSWNICDYRFFQTRQQAIHEWETSPWPRDKQMSRKEAVLEWFKIYKRK